MDRPRLRAATPLLVVADLDRSVRFYRDRLGYQQPSVWGDPPCFGMLHRDGLDLMLQAAERPGLVQPHGAHGVWDLHLRVDDLAAEIAALQAQGTPIDRGPTDTFYGMREIEVLDPDGHRICLAQDLTAHERGEAWQGTLDVGAAKLRLRLELRPGENGWTGVLDSLDQNAFGMRVEALARDADGLQFTMAAIDAAFRGRFARDGRELVGTWSQRGRSWPLAFARD